MNHYEFEMPCKLDEDKFTSAVNKIEAATKRTYHFNWVDNPKMIVVSCPDSVFMTFEMAFKFGILFHRFY